MSVEAIRDAILSAPPVAAREKIEINGEVVEVLAPTLALWAKVANAAVDTSTGVTDIEKSLILSVIYFTVKEGTTDTIFKLEDYDLLASMPNSGWFAKLTTAALQIGNAADKQAEAEKKSEKTTNIELISS